MQGLRALLTRELVAGLVGGLVAAITVAACILAYWHFSGNSSDNTADRDDRRVPLLAGQAAMDRITCGQGETRLVVMHGLEDNFAPQGDEPATMRPALLEVPAFRSRAGLEDRPRQLRDYDQLGTDLHLVDHFELPRGILSGAVVFSGLGQSKLAWNDHLEIGDVDYSKWPDAMRPGISYFGPGEVSEGTVGEPARLEGLRVIRLEEFLSGAGVASPPDLLTYLNSADRPDAVDVLIEDDTAVDFLAFVLCLEPEEARATTFREHRLKPGGPDISFLHCSGDMMQPECNANSGDHVCTVASPIFCYRDGNRFAPEEIDAFRREGNWGAGYVVGGEVRASEPVVPDEFPTIERANGYCAAQFGRGWRVLSFHESGGYAVMSRSDVAPQSRGIVHVADSPYGNCWDRPESVLAR